MNVFPLKPPFIEDVPLPCLMTPEGATKKKKPTFTSPDIFHGGVHSPSLFWKSVSLLEDRFERMQCKPH
jgi:hypothetical protein